MEQDPQLAVDIRKCTRCPLGELRLARGGIAVPAEVGKDYLPGGLAIMVEAPGAQEDATGRPLVGPTGDLFNEFLGYAGLRRSDVVILERVRCRPPGNSLANYVEAATEGCDPWTARELEHYNPSVVLLMGKTALTMIFGRNEKVGETRGTLRSTEGRTWLATYHPAAALPFRNPQLGDVIVEDMKLARTLVGLVRDEAA